MNCINLNTGYTKQYTACGVSTATISLLSEWFCEAIAAKAPVKLPSKLIIELLLQEFSKEKLEETYSSDCYVGYSGSAFATEGALMVHVDGVAHYPIITFMFSCKANPDLWIKGTPYKEPVAPWAASFHKEQGLKLHPECMIWLPKLQFALGTLFMTIKR